VAEVPKACEWVHLPVQSGSNELLRRMARRYTREHYLDLVRRIRAAMPEAAITTDIIVGFPGETREQFRETLSLVEEVQYDGAYTFAYSPRPGTAAFQWVDDVGRAEKQARLQELIELQNRISRTRNEAQVGREFEVLVEGPTSELVGQLTGLTRTNKTVNFLGTEDLIGHLVTIRAAQGQMWGFMGALVGRPSGEADPGADLPPGHSRPGA